MENVIFWNCLFLPTKLAGSLISVWSASERYSISRVPPKVYLAHTWYQLQIKELSHRKQNLNHLPQGDRPDICFQRIHESCQMWCCVISLHKHFLMEMEYSWEVLENLRNEACIPAWPWWTRFAPSDKMSLSIPLGSGPEESSRKYLTQSMAAILSKDSYVLNEDLSSAWDKQEVKLKLTHVKYRQRPFLFSTFLSNQNEYINELLSLVKIKYVTRNKQQG